MVSIRKSSFMLQEGKNARKVHALSLKATGIHDLIALGEVVDALMKGGYKQYTWPDAHKDVKRAITLGRGHGQQVKMAGIQDGGTFEVMMFRAAFDIGGKKDE